VKVTSEKLPESQVLLNIEVDEATVDRSVEQAYRRLVNQVNIPGFRRGKAPRQLVERYLGKETLLQEGVERLIPEVYRQAVQETGIQPVDQPEFDIVQMRPLVLKATVPVEPTVELGNYQDFRLAPIEVAVSDEQVNDFIERLREQRAEWVPVDRPLRAGDLVSFDVEGVTGVPTFYSASGEPILQLGGGQQVVKESNAEVIVAPQAKTPVPGLQAELIGMTPGQEKRFQLTLPEDFAQSEFAGKDAIFRVVVHSIKEKHLPALDDEFAKAVGEYETLEALRADLKQTLQRSLEREAHEQFENSVIQAAVDRSRVELPAALIDREVERMVSDLRASLAAQRISMEEYLRVTGRGSESELREQLRPDAERRLRTYFVIDAIGRAEGIEVSPSEIQQEIERMVARAGEQAERMRRLLETPERRENISLQLWNQKVIDRLEAIATGKGESGTTEAEAASAPAPTEAAPAEQDAVSAEAPAAEEDTERST